MVPEPLRLKRSKKVEAAAPEGASWCAGCQTFRDLVDFGKGATTCKACASARSHATRTEKTYGLTPDQYDALLKMQGGRCAICRARPKSKRLAVDHDHKTGAVRGLCCSRCNHDLLGSAWDSQAMVTALWHYLNTPPASGSWVTPEEQPPLSASVTARESSRASFAALGTDKPGARNVAAAPTITAVGPKERTGKIAEIHALTPEGLELIGGTRDERGAVRIYVPKATEADPPF